ncbi:MAG: aconitate hydratase, partial [Rhodospirillales bacterium]|nr:aconitate hydratase [Acetobacter sp.]
MKYKGHLPNISRNTLIGALSADTNAVNTVTDLDGSTHTIPDLAEKWSAQNQPWLVVAEHNYGEGSAREHAALQPRYLGARIIV